MGWPYQLVDWFWYQHMTDWNKNLFAQPNQPSGDFTQSVPDIDLPALVAYARAKNVRLFVWGHSLDVQTAGIDKTLGHLASLGVAGVKIDFINSDSQEAVQWCVRLLEAAARHHLMVHFHGTYKPTGLARTYPKFHHPGRRIRKRIQQTRWQRHRPPHPHPPLHPRAPRPESTSLRRFPQPHSVHV